MRVLTTILLLMIPAWAYAWTGNDLLSWCQSGHETYFEGVCFGYINGIYDGYDLGIHVGATMGVDEVLDSAGIKTADNPLASRTVDGVSEKYVTSIFCEHNVNAKQIRDISVKWLQDHPERRNQDASVLVIASFEAAFPANGKCHPQ